MYAIEDDVIFCDGPGMLIRKTAMPCTNNILIPLLIHGFVPVKTRLLIAGEPVFYTCVQYLPRGQADINVLENMFDHCYCIKKHFVARKLWRNSFEKFFFPVPTVAQKGTLHVNVLKTPPPGQRITSS